MNRFEIREIRDERYLTSWSIYDNLEKKELSIMRPNEGGAATSVQVWNKEFLTSLCALYNEHYGYEE